MGTEPIIWVCCSVAWALLVFGALHVATKVTWSPTLALVIGTVIASNVAGMIRQLAYEAAFLQRVSSHTFWVGATAHGIAMALAIALTARWFARSEEDAPPRTDLAG